MAYVFCQKPKGTADAALPRPCRAAFEGGVQAQTQGACHAQHPVMAAQTFEIAERGFSQAEYLHERQRNEQRPYAQFGALGCKRYKIA